MKILLSYLKPYKGLVFLTLFLAAINMGFSMIDPILLGKLVNLAADNKAIGFTSNTFFWDYEHIIRDGKPYLQLGVLYLVLLSISVAMISRIAKAFQDYFLNLLIQKFGAKDIFDLNWKHLLDAYTCTECGRCTAACPANRTGKLLSPRKIMMDTRDRMEDVRKNIKTNGEFKDDGKTLLYDYITTEELWACTSCNACVQECPVSINPLDIIFELRRSLIMEESKAPAEWNNMFSNIENNFAPWKFSPDDRDNWTKEM